MERIKQAIEKARNQHVNEPVRNVKVRLKNTAPPITSSPSIELDSLEDISYQNTRIVNLQPEILEKNRIVAIDKNDPKSMVFDILRTHVLKKMEENGWKSLAITSPTPEAGKTVVAINLAISIAQKTNKTAMLVDFDLRRPKVGKYLGLPMEKSLNDLLDGSATLPEVIVNPDIPRLVVLPTKNPVRKSSEILSSRKISELVKDISKRYESRIVIFDLPPMLVSDDVISLIPQVDCVLLVVANGMCTKREIEEALRHLPAAKLIGTVLNKEDITQNAYYYDY
jgi:capsular exopolysaccharide synthesis family protein